MNKVEFKLLVVVGLAEALEAGRVGDDAGAEVVEVATLVNLGGELVVSGALALVVGVDVPSVERVVSSLLGRPSRPVAVTVKRHRQSSAPEWRRPESFMSTRGWQALSGEVRLGAGLSC